MTALKERRKELGLTQVDRRAFLTGMAGVAIDAVLPTSPPIRLGGNDISRMRSVLVNSYRLDEQHGGAGAVLVLAERNFHRLRGLVSKASYGEAVGRDLRELTGMAAEHIAWLAYDASDHDKASHWSSQALHWGRLADSDAVRVVTLASMAGQASERMQARTAIELAAAAQSTSKMTTPRLMSMLLAEEALGHATAGDRSMARRTLSRARALAGQDRIDDDPAWLEFYGPAEFASYEHKSALRMRDSATAALAARNALTLNDHTAYPRNHALYTVQLAHALIQRREIDEAATIAKRAAVLASDLDSTRVKHGILALAHSLAPYRDIPTVRSFLEPLQPT